MRCCRRHFDAGVLPKCKTEGRGVPLARKSRRNTKVISKFGRCCLRGRRHSLKPMFSFRVGLAPWLALLGVLLTNGCLSSKPETKEQVEKRAAVKRAKSAEVIKSSVTKEEHQISIPELDQLTYRYADR